MGKAQAEVPTADPSDLSAPADAIRERVRGGLSRLAAGASRSAKKVREAAQDLRNSPAVQHALAARDRGNLEAAFWLLNEAFDREGDAGVALHYWDVALSLGRVDIAAEAGVALVESRAAAGEPELAAQHWLELVKEAPDVLVSPTAIATLLPALKLRCAEASEDGPEDQETLAGYLRRAVRHAVDPRNTGLHPGVALRIFEEGREANPEAARRAAEAALESPHLHETKRERLEDWLAGKTVSPKETRAPAPSARPTSSGAADSNGGLSTDEIEAAAARLPKPAQKVAPEPEPEAKPNAVEEPAAAEASEPDPEPVDAREDDTESLEVDADDVPCDDGDLAPRVSPARLEALDDDGLDLPGLDGGRLPWSEVQAVCVAEVMGLEEQPVALVDLIRNWTERDRAPLQVVRLRVAELDLQRLVTRKHALGSDFAALMGEIMERSAAIPLPDPESALGTRITCFETPALYERVALRLDPEAAAQR